MHAKFWRIISGIVYALSGLALACVAILGVGGYVFYMVVWLHAPSDKVLLFSLPCALVLLVGAHASVRAAREAFKSQNQ